MSDYFSVGLLEFTLLSRGLLNTMADVNPMSQNEILKSGAVRF